MSRTTSHHELNRLDLGLETLEKRVLLAGSVFIDVVGNELRVIGDGSDNSLLMDFAHSAPQQIHQGLSGTSIHFGANIDDPFDHVSIQMKDGDDSVEVRNLHRENGNFKMDGGHGANTFRVMNSRGGQLEVARELFSDTPQQSTLLQDSRFTDAAVRTANGSTDTQIVRSEIRNLSIDSLEGTDNILMDRTQIGDRIAQNNGSLRISTGVGSSTIRIQASGPGSGTSIHSNDAIIKIDGRQGLASNHIEVRDIRMRNTRLQIESGPSFLTQIDLSNIDKLRQVDLEANESATIINADGVNVASGNFNIGLQYNTMATIALRSVVVSGSVDVKADLGLAPSGSPLQVVGVVLSSSTVGGRLYVRATSSGEAPLTAARFLVQNSIVEGAVTFLAPKLAQDSELLVSGSVLKNRLSFSGGDLGASKSSISGGQISGQVVINHFGATGETTLENGARLGDNLTIKKSPSDQADDKLRIQGGANVLGMVSLNHGHGKSDVAITESAILARNVLARSGEGQDLFELNDAEIRGSLRIQNYTGESMTTMTDSHIAGSLNLDNSQGTPGVRFENGFDALFIIDTDILRGINVRHGSGGSQTEITRSEFLGLRLTALQGNDDVRVNDVEPHGPVVITTGTSNRALIAAVGGSDQDVVSFDRNGSPGASIYHSLVMIATFGDDDSIRLAGTLSLVNSATFLGRVILNGGDGQDEFIEGLYSTFAVRPRLTSLEV